MIPVETLRMGVREAKPRSDSLTEADSIRRREGAFKFQMIAISTFLFFLYIGMEVSYAGYLLTYAVKVGCSPVCQGSRTSFLRFTDLGMDSLSIWAWTKVTQHGSPLCFGARLRWGELSQCCWLTAWVPANF
eukprot:m.603547 g.603547  ORF g.603547 m.603547 type:complete len:132 (+) comp58103_c0_seq54:711-1106(+)